jgi:hypothetical protein
MVFGRRVEIEIFSGLIPALLWLYQQEANKRAANFQKLQPVPFISNVFNTCFPKTPHPMNPIRRFPRSYPTVFSIETPEMPESISYLGKQGCNDALNDSTVVNGLRGQ